MSVKMILAIDRGNAIGWTDGRLPWKIAADMKRFKELTLNSTVLMGRKTFESLGRPKGLPNRFNIVITSKLDGYDEDVLSCNMFENMVRATQDHSDYRPVEDIWIIGGATIYDQAIDLQLVDEIYLTLVDTNSGADVTLTHNLSDWKLFVLRQAKNGVQWNLTEHSLPQKTDDNINFTFLTLKKTP